MATAFVVFGSSVGQTANTLLFQMLISRNRRASMSKRNRAARLPKSRSPASLLARSEHPAKRVGEAGWRRRRDSNPRYGFRPYNGLANRRLQPLGHVSNGASAYRIEALRSNLGCESGDRGV